MDVEWSKRKAAVNERKHGVSFHEAGTVFGDPFAITFSDPDHSVDELRYLTFGVSLQNRVLVVSHTEREDRIRIISARRATKGERMIYEESEN